MPQQPNNGWTPVDTKPSDGWTPVGAQPGEEGYEAASQPYGPPPPDTAIGGALRRGKQIVQGMYKTVADPPTEEEQKRGFSTDTAGQILQRPLLATRRVVGGVVEGEKQAAGQVKEQVKAAREPRAIQSRRDWRMRVLESQQRRWPIPLRPGL